MVSNISTLAQSTTLIRYMMEMQVEMARLQKQIASGKKAETYSQLRTDARASLNLQASRASIETMANANAVTKVRMDAIQAALLRLSEIASEIRDKARVATTGVGLPADSGNEVLRSIAASRLNEVTTILNTQVDGVYVFAGRKFDTPPMPAPGAVGETNTPLDNVALLDTDYPLDNTSASGVNRYAAITKHLDSSAAAPPGWPPTAPTPASATTPYYYQGEIGPNAHLSATIDIGLTIDYGINAIDSSVQSLLRGLYALATTDLTTATDAGFRAIADLAADDLDAAFKGLNAESANLGVQQATLRDVTTKHYNALTLITEQIIGVEDLGEAGMAEAIARVSQQQANLEASYRLIAGLKDLTLAKLL
ncbi:MAG TPA: hypothetical protein VF342_07905 [Alphaproteobacteria bacterium]